MFSWGKKKVATCQTCGDKFSSKKCCKCRSRVFCLINSKSGAGKGQKVIDTLRTAGINCWSLCDINSDILKSLAYMLQGCKQTPVVLCGGGDGTNSWALETLERARKIAEFDYHFGTIPLGSGNDLSNALGWGNKYPQSKNLVAHCVKVVNSKTFTKLDRWNIDATRNGESVPVLSNEMLNYFNIGYGAKIAAEFHKARERSPNVWNSPKKNFWKYAQLSVKHMITRNRVLNEDLEIYADGKRVTLPKGTRDIAITNINSMAQGEFYWGTGKSRKGELQKFTSPEMGDGKLEIMTSNGMSNNVKMAFGSHYHRLAQASTIKIVVKRTQAISWDGEASYFECSEESPLSLSFSCKGQVVSPVGSKSPRGVTATVPKPSPTAKPSQTSKPSRKTTFAGERRKGIRVTPRP